jgi:hypothetical protein
MSLLLIYLLHNIPFHEHNSYHQYYYYILTYLAVPPIGTYCMVFHLFASISSSPNYCLE